MDSGLTFMNEPSKGEQFDVIVSFATYRKRLERRMIRPFLERIVNQEFTGKYHIVANLWKPDFEFVHPKMKQYMEEHGIEVVLSDVDRKTHNKYCYVFQKYKGIPIITFDDDQIYRKDAVQLLCNTHLNHPRTLIGGFCVIPTNKKDKLGKLIKPRPKSGTEPSPGIQLWGSGGNFYPPEFTEKITINMIEEWIQNSAVNCKYDNDMYLFRMAKRFGFNGMVVECNHEKPTWRGYLVEKFLPTADDETAKTWNKA